MGMVPREQSRPRRGLKPFQLAIGRDFGGVDAIEAKTRGFLARLIASAAATGVAVAGGKSLLDGNYAAVIGCWAVAGPIVGALVAYYFGLRGKDSG